MVWTKHTPRGQAKEIVAEEWTNLSKPQRIVREDEVFACENAKRLGRTFRTSLAVLRMAASEL